MSKAQSQRIQTSLLNPYEKVVLVWIASRLPKWVKSDHLTAFGVLGAVVIALGYTLTAYGSGWLWLASFGFVMHWLGDSLDGTIARVRNTQRPIYGFYIDHNLDCVCELLMVGGAGLSPYLNMWSSLLVVVPYLMLEVYVMINAHLKSEFKLTYSKLGPTEFRLVIILVNTIIFFSDTLREWSMQITPMGYDVTIRTLDIVCLTFSVILFVMYFNSLYSDAKYFAKLDPLKKNEAN